MIDSGVWVAVRPPGRNAWPDAIARVKLAMVIARESFSAWGLLGYDDMGSIDARGVHREDWVGADRLEVSLRRDFGSPLEQTFFNARDPEVDWLHEYYAGG
jgi:hypothetical protein